MNIRKHYKFYKPKKNIIPFYEMLANSGNHALIAGTTGSGKSVLLNNSINYLLSNYSPDEIQFIFIDPKIVELQQYKTVIHTISYLSDIQKINNILQGLIYKMQERYKIMSRRNLKTWDGVKIICIIDEIADLLTAYGTQSKQFALNIKILLAKARAAGINFIICTQAPNRRVIPAEIVLNIPTRCALRCLSPIESRQIINMSGAELLPKYGSCLLLSPELLNIKRYDFPMTPQFQIDETIKAWTKKGKMLI